MTDGGSSATVLSSLAEGASTGAFDSGTDKALAVAPVQPAIGDGKSIEVNLHAGHSKSSKETPFTEAYVSRHSRW